MANWSDVRQAEVRSSQGFRSLQAAGLLIRLISAQPIWRFY